MKKLNALNLGKSLNRNEMKTINGGLVQIQTCTCGTGSPQKVATGCNCNCYCEGYTAGC